MERTADGETVQAHRVVVVGGGFGGLFAVRALSKAGVEVTLVDRHNFHLFQPLAYQVATGALSAAEIASPLRAILKGQKNVRVILAEVIGFDFARREVTLDRLPNGERHDTLAYDTLLVAGGSRYSYFGHDDWHRFAPELKSLAGALEIRSRILGAFEAAEVEQDPDRRRSWLTFVVVGAGPTGVEMAGQIAELARDTLRRDYHAVDTRTARVLLVEAADRVLTSFPQSLSHRAERALEHLGVTPLLGHLVVEIGAESVGIQAPTGEVERIDARTVIWAAGVTASELAGTLARNAGIETDRVGRVPVEPDLALAGHPEVLAIGDMVTMKMPDGTTAPLPGVAPCRDAAGPLCGPFDRRSARGPIDAAVHIRRQGQPRDDRTLESRRRCQRHPDRRLPGLGALARRPPLLPDRLPESTARRASLDGQLPHPRPRRPPDRRTGLRPRPARRH